MKIKGKKDQQQSIFHSDFSIIENKKIATKTYSLTLFGEINFNLILPGQFIHLELKSNSYQKNAFILRRPFSLCDVDVLNKTLRIIYKIQGEGTLLLSTLKPHSKLNLIGPLGTHLPIEDIAKKHKHMTLIGGGVGVPPLLFIAKKLFAQSIKIDFILGFNSNDEIFLADELKQYGSVYISIIEGNSKQPHTYKGNCLDFLHHLDEKNQLQGTSLFSCGPKGLLIALFHSQYINKIKKENAYFSLEERMGCGIGACLACVLFDHKNQTYKKICKDGPVIQGDHLEL